MKQFLYFFFLLISIGMMQSVSAQGWKAAIELNFPTLQSVTSAEISFADAYTYASSGSSDLTVELYGQRVPSGPMHVFAQGRSTSGVFGTYVSAVSYSITYSGCDVISLDFDSQASGDVYGMYRLYPQMQITEVEEQCDRVTLITETCSNVPYTWEVSESLSGPFKVIGETRANAIDVSTAALAALGLKPYGRKFFRVTGNSGTTSPLEVADFYYPPPSASFSTTAPQCHDGQDGAIEIDIISSYPAGINDFIVTVRRNVEGSEPSIVHQVTLENTTSFTADGLQAGYYTVIIENHSNTSTYGPCWATFDVGLLANPLAVVVSSAQVSDYNGYQIQCKGGSDGTIAIQPSGGTGVFTHYEWAPQVSETNKAANLGEGAYTVRVQDSNNCWSLPFRRTLVAPEKLFLALQSTGGKGGFDVSCANEGDGRITSNPSGGVAPYTFLWSTGSTEPDISELDTGTYHARISDHNGCTNESTLTLTAPEPIDFTIDNLTEIRCAGDHTGVLQVQSVVNTIGQVFYSWSSGESGVEVSEKGAGTYTVAVSDEQGCKRAKSHLLEEPLAYSVEIHTLSDYNGSPIRCYGGASGRLSAIVKDENNTIVAAEYYSWYKDNKAFNDSGTSASVLEGAAAGSYTVKIGYNDVCETQSSLLLSEPDPVSPVISVETRYNGVPISCHGASDGSIEVTAVGGTGDAYAYLWTSGETDSLLTGLPAGRYAVNATDINGCEGTAAKILVAPDPVDASITVLSNFNGQALSCTNASDARIQGAAMGGTSFFSYRWNTGEATRDLIDIPSGNYVLTAEDANGCTDTAAITIMNPLPVQADIVESSSYNGFGVSCYGTRDGFLSSRPTGGTGTYTFDWNDGAFSGSKYPNLGAGAYVLRIEDKNGCNATNTMQITEPPALTLAVTDVKNTSCNSGDDGSISLKALGGAGDYLYGTTDLPWQPQPTLTGLKAGPYLVQVSDANGCQATTSQALTEPAALLIHFSDIQPALCGDPRGQVSASATGGTGAYQYLWSSNFEGDFISEQRNITSLTAGMYTLKVTDAHLCEVISSVGISATDGPKVETSTIASPTCSYSSDGNAALAVAGDGPFTFLWQDGQTNPQAINLRKGDYLVEVRDAHNCGVVKTVTIPAPDSLRINLVQKTEPLCHGDCNGELVVTANGGNGNYFYDWGNTAGPEADALCAGQYGIKVVDEKGCIAKETFVLQEPEPLTVKLLSSQAPACPDGCDGSIVIETSGGIGEIQPNWSTGSNALALKDLCAGSYTATLRDANQCVAEETFVLENPSVTRLDLGGPVTLCEGQTYILDPGTYWLSYGWTSSTGFTSSAQRVNISEAGMYWLEAISKKGCVVRDTFALQTSRDLLKANFLLTTEAMTNDTIVLIDISWPLPENTLWILPEEMNRLADDGDLVYGKFPSEGQYEISLIASLGNCHDQMTKTITVLGENEPEDDAGRLGHEPFVKEFTLYPNPNGGMFDVKVELLDESPIVLTIWNTMTAKKVGQVKASGRSEYLKYFDLRPLSAGTYSIRLDYGNGMRYLRFIVR